MAQTKQGRGVSVLMNAFITGMFALCLAQGANATPGKESPPLKIADTVVKVPLAKDVSMDDAVQAMKSRANELNMKLVAELPLSKQIIAMGEKSRRIDIYQFCDPLTAKKMVEYDIHFSAYLPCRIVLVEDQKGQGWLLMMNLNLFLGDPEITPSLRTDAIAVRDALDSIIQAGAKGEF